MQTTPNDSGAQSCRKISAGPLRLGRVIILALLLLLLILPFATAQTPRPRPDLQNLFPAKPRPPVNVLSATPAEQKFHLTVSKEENVQIDEWLSFEVRPGPRSEIVEYHFSFGDGEKTVTKDPQALHRYRSSQTYVAQAEVQIRTVRDRGSSIPTDTRRIDVVGVRPAAPTPTPIDVTSPVRVSPKPPQVQATSSPEPPPARTTSSPRPTRFRPRATPSPTATPPPPPPPPVSRWVLILLGGLLLGVLVRSVWPRPIIPPPTFYLHWDRGAPQTKQQENVAINYELHFDPNFVQGKHELDTLETDDLITSIRRNND